MALLRLVTASLETAGHGIATGATALADLATGGRVPELRNAREEQERRLHAAARGVEQHARVVGADVGRAVETAGVSAGVLASIVADPDQRKRLAELIETYDLAGFARALAQPGGRLPPGFFPAWTRRAGGYFPKLAQVLSVRADLIHDREVLEQFGRCLEDMPVRPAAKVREHLLSSGWPQNVCEGVGEALNAGTVAQVNDLRLPDGGQVVVKVAWPDTRRQMHTDFRLFSHARSILRALRLEDQQAQSVAAIFAAVGKSECAVLREFDMLAEARALVMAAELCRPGGEWDGAYSVWLSVAEATLQRTPPPLTLLGLAFVHRARASGCTVGVPAPFPGLASEAALAMSRAGGLSLHHLLSGGGGAEGCREAARVLMGSAIPFIGWLLLCKSTSHLAHVDPHPGNFRWDAGSQTLWVLDWGSNVKLPGDKRRALCLLIAMIAASPAEDEDEAIAEVARGFGVRGRDCGQLARLMRGMLNATPSHAAQDALNAAAVDSVLEDVDEEVVPVVRCLATLGGLLKELQRRVRDEHQQNMQLSLAGLWEPFATMGLAT